VRAARPVACEPLTAAAFAPYGAVLDTGAAWTPANEGRARRYPAASLPAPGADARGARLDSAIYVIAPSTLPFQARVFERHPHSAQIFQPASDGPYLVCVCGSAADGEPDFATARAFIATPPAGIVYAPGVWHLPLAALEREGRFLMLMWALGDARDCEEHAVPGGLLIGG
jgi:ureidoglycolate lyase